MDRLLAEEKKQENELLRTQISDYRAFVKELVTLGEIMSKQFYVVVPYDPRSNKSKGFFARFGEVINPTAAVKVKGEKFTKRKYDLDQRIRQIESGLSSMGLTIVRLDTQSLIELFFSTYNTDIALSQELGDVDDLRVES
jgi:hypothetical protein